MHPEGTADGMSDQATRRARRERAIANLRFAIPGCAVLLVLGGVLWAVTGDPSFFVIPVGVTAGAVGLPLVARHHDIRARPR
jgi:hypothetical protein